MDTQRILIVDDDYVNRSLLQHILLEEGYTDCHEATNGKEALEVAEKISPDLILLDIVMPEMNGYDVAKYLKKHTTLYLPIIFITASDDRKKHVKCLEVGGDDFATKPFDKFVLSAKIQAHLRIRSMAQRIAAQNQELSAYRQSVVREHAIVEHIYEHALKNPSPSLAFFDLVQKPADTFNGDLFLTQPHPSGGVYFLLGDFTGHGLASTVGAIPVSRVFNAMTSEGNSVVEIAIALNETVREILPADRFFAATIAHINDSGRRAILWQGGMPDLFVQRAFDNSVEACSAKHMALGILEAAEFESDCSIIDLEPGDALYVSSDGLVESKSLAKIDGVITESLLGETAFRNWIVNNPNISCQNIIKLAKTRLNRDVFDDDVTLVKFVSCDLTSLRKQSTLSRLPFSFTVSIEPNELKADDAIEQVMKIISNQQGMATVRSDVFTVLSEMYTNAVEHGLLKLDSSLKATPEGFMKYYEDKQTRLERLETGFIRIEVNLYPVERRLAISVTDSGDGFDYHDVISDDDDASYGRGLQLMTNICEALYFEGSGNRVVVELSL